MPDALILLTWVLKATAILALASGLTLVLRRSAAGTRYLVWLASLAVVLLVPLVAWWAPLQVAVLPASASPIAVVASEADASNAPATLRAPRDDARVAQPDNQRQDAGAVTPAPTPNRWADPASVVLFVWLAGVATLLGWLGVSALIVHRHLRRARPLEGEDWSTPLYEVADRLNLNEAPRLLVSDDIEMPFACGFLRETIVLPSSAMQWSDERRRVVLFHELAHVRRRDLLGHTLGRVTCALYWFHPLVWSAAKRLRAESERACDDLVLACGARPSDYANHLLEIVTSVRHRPAPAGALAMANKKEFEGRMLAILDPEVFRRTLGRARTVGLVAGIGVFSLAISAAAPTRRAADTTVLPHVATDASLGSSDASGIISAAQQLDSIRKATTATRPVETKGEPTADEVAAEAEAASEAALDAESDAAEEDEEDTDSKDGSGTQTQQRNGPKLALLARIARTDKDPDVRRAAVWGMHGRAELGQVLADVLRTDVDEDVREMAAWALQRIRGEAAYAALSAALRSDSSAEVRATAAWALGHKVGAGDLEVLVAALRDRNPRVRKTAMWAIGHTGVKTAPPAVVSALRDPDEEVRLLAAWVLGGMLDRATIPALRAAFMQETDEEVLSAELRALAFMKDTSPELLDHALKSQHAEIRARAVRLIAGLGTGPWPWPWPWPDPRPQP